jgi:glutaredoxin
MNITLYTTPTCSDCQALKAWLGGKGIRYQEKDLTDTNIQVEAKSRYGVRIAPITVIDDQFFYGTFAEQRPKLAPLLDSSL